MKRSSGLSGYSAGSPGGGFLGAAPATVILRPKPGATPGFPGFFAWLAARHPDVYDVVRVSIPDHVADIEGLRSGGAQLGGPLDISALSQFSTPIADATTNETASGGTPQPSPGFISQIISTVTQAANAILPVIQDQKLLQLQLDRARQGLQPLDTSRYQSATAGLQVGINRSTQTTLLYIAGGLAGVFVLSRLLRAR